MTSFYSQTTRTVQRVHDQVAHDFTVYQYDWDGSGGTNEYASGGDWTESSSTVAGTIEFPDDSRRTAGPDGDDVTVSVVIYMKPDDVDVELGTDDESRATEFVDTQTGSRYQTVTIRNQRSLLAIECTEI
ncbi:MULTISPECIES: hypothetical protein [Haloarcula]|uniref:hypothetical protein n=1 Tax=Haloarcula TaxID=2237 RepID=UPI000F8DBE6C|nr:MULTISPECIES: hypothetical protein [Haloarcula]NHX41387.1 hypothetical protein [Haloarcula sp. R1-2]